MDCYAMLGTMKLFLSGFQFDKMNPESGYVKFKKMATNKISLQLTQYSLHHCGIGNQVPRPVLIHDNIMLRWYLHVHTVTGSLSPHNT